MIIDEHKVGRGGFQNLGSSARNAIYVLNSLLIIVFAILLALISPMLVMVSLYAAGSISEKGGLFPVAAIALILLWFAESFSCFIIVIAITARKRKWNWTLQFLPFVTAAIFYLLLVAVGNFSS